MPAAAKRPAAAPAAKPVTAKAARTRPTSPNAKGARSAAQSPKAKARGEFADITDLIRQVDGYPECVLDMLAASLSGAAVPKETRHPIQTKVLGMIEEVLQSHVAAAKGRVEAASAAVGTATTEREARQQTVHTATSELSAASATLAEKKAQCEHLTELLTTAKGAQTAAEAAEAQAVTAVETVSTSQAGLKAVLDMVEALRRGNPEPSRAAVAKNVLDGLKTYSFDESLVASLSSVLVKEPEGLVEFDKMVIGQLELELQSRVKDIEQEHGKAAEGRDSAAQAKQAAAADTEAAKEKAQAAAAEVDAARGDVASRDEALKAANAALQEEEAKTGGASEELGRLKRELEALESGVIRKFQELRELSSAPKVAEGAAAEEPATPAKTDAPEGAAAESATLAGTDAPEGATAESGTGVTSPAAGSEAAELPEPMVTA